MEEHIKRHMQEIRKLKTILVSILSPGNYATELFPIYIVVAVVSLAGLLSEAMFSATEALWLKDHGLGKCR